MEHKITSFWYKLCQEKACIHLIETICLTTSDLYSVQTWSATNKYSEMEDLKTCNVPNQNGRLLHMGKPYAVAYMSEITTISFVSLQY